MHRNWGIRVSILVSACVLAQAQPRPGAPAPTTAPAPDTLPVKRVVLYKSGVGYFEHLGTVRDNQEVTVAFTSGQLNDVLKSLTVLDLDGGRIAGVEYGSQAPVDRQLGALRLPVGEKASLTDVLAALRGARLEVHSGTNTIAGRLLSVERKTRIAGGTTLEVDYLSLLSDKGELKTTELSPAFSVRLLDQGLPDKMDRFLDVVSAGREADVRRMVISTAGSGQRSLFVSYISEVPVWKTTYRIVLRPKAGPLLQGWAIVDNTVGEDWDRVQLSLVAGAPHSFIQNLSQPYYSRRPVVPLPESVSVAPQTYEATLVPGPVRVAGTVRDPSGASIPNVSVKAYDSNGKLIAATTSARDGTYEFASLPDNVTRLDFDRPGFRTTRVTSLEGSSGWSTRQDVEMQVGSTAEVVSVQAAIPGINMATASRVNAGRSLGSGAGLGQAERAAKSPVRNFTPPGANPAAIGAARDRAESAARAQDLGDLFEFKLKEPITIRKNQSALVPIVQSGVQAEKVSVWNEQAGPGRPQRALWLTNSSGLTLDGGSFSVMEDDTFAGEGIFDPIRPGEKRLIAYATDLALNVRARSTSEHERVTHVILAKGMLTQENELREKKAYTFRNEDSTPRSVIVEHPVRLGYELRGDARPVETTAAWNRFRLEVGAKQTSALVVEEARTEQTTYALSNLDANQVALFVKQRSVNPELEAALRRVLAQKDAVAGLESQKSAREEDIEQIFDDQQRLRENMKSLKGSAEEKALLQRYTQQLNAQETRLEELHKEVQQLSQQKDAAQVALDRTIEELAFDVKL